MYNNIVDHSHYSVNHTYVRPSHLENTNHFSGATTLTVMVYSYSTTGNGIVVRFRSTLHL